ncbi:MAG: hypothetical protein ABFD89_01020 [Bryobacteraceae bacterium]
MLNPLSLEFGPALDAWITREPEWEEDELEDDPDYHGGKEGER